MRKRMLGRKLTAMVSGVAGVLVLAGAVPASAEPARVLSDFSIGIEFLPDNTTDQCGGPQQQWSNGSDWTEPIRLNTDNRSGGCRLAFSIYDPFGELGGIQFWYNWVAHPGADASQCGPVFGQKAIPVLPFQLFPSHFRIDTDGRQGWCDLTFSMSSRIGRNDVGLEVKFYPDGHVDQCKNATPPDQPRLVTVSQAVTFGVDTDDRVGGCLLSLRLRYL
jgi:hypothetical protein